jgi:hypothetical protein
MRSQRGIAAVEFALLLVPLLTLCFAGLECALALQRYQSIQSSLSAATRYLSLSQAGDPHAIQAAKCLVITGDPSMSSSQCIGTPLVPNSTIAQVVICDISNCTNGQQMVLSGGKQLNLVSVTMQGVEMNDFPEWLNVLVFPTIQYSLVQSTS